MFNNGQLTVLNIRDILPNRFQPRIKFDEEKLEELADSISKYGVIQPIVVRPVGNKFEIIAGERRFKASKLANRSTIPAIIVNLSDKDSEEIALLENVQRQQLSPIEEAVSYKRILDMGYITQEGLAKKIGKSQSTIANKIRLLNLDDEVQSYLLNNKISERHARSLLKIPDKEKQVEMLHRIVNERLTVKQTDREIAKLKEQEEQKVKPIDLNISVIKPVKRESVQPTVPPKSEEIETLFDDEDFTKDERGNDMDIDKIMRDARDINSGAPVQGNVSNLMSSADSNSIGVKPSIDSGQSLNVTNLEPNKFINVPQQEVSKPQPTQPVNNGVTFDSVFNQHITPEPTSNPQMPPVMDNNVNNNEAPINPSVNVSMPNDTQSINMVNNTAFEQPISNNQVNVQPEVNVNPQPVNSQVNNGFSIPEIPKEEINSNNSGPNIYATSEDNEVSFKEKKAISEAVATALKTYNENKTRYSMASAIPMPVSDSLSENAQNEYRANSIPDTNILADDTLSEYSTGGNNLGNVQPTMASTITQDVKQTSNPTHFADIVKMLRDCADKIEQNGYFVNVDELDIGNQYKVTFTIDKG